MAALMTAFTSLPPDIVHEVWATLGGDFALCHSALNEIMAVQCPAKSKMNHFPRIRKMVRFTEHRPPVSRLESAISYARAMTDTFHHHAEPILPSCGPVAGRHAASCADEVPIRRTQPPSTSTFFENASRVALKLKRKAKKAQRQELQYRSMSSGSSVEQNDGGYCAADASMNSSISEISCSCLDREDAILHGRKLLARRLTGLNVKEHAMVDDGNCLFRAVSHQLYATQDHHLRLRQLACIQIEKQSSIYWAYFDGSKDFHNYLTEMKRPGVWGDEIALKALCDALGTVVYVLLSTPGNWYLRYVPRQCSTPDQIGAARKLFLSYLSPIHYNSITYNDGMLITLAPEEALNFPELKSVKKPTSKAFWV